MTKLSFTPRDVACPTSLPSVGRRVKPLRPTGSLGLFVIASIGFFAACSSDTQTGDDSGIIPPGEDGSTPADSPTSQPDSGPPDTGPVMCGGSVCASGEECVNDHCLCLPGYVPAATGCTPAPAGNPAAHTKADVCAHWASGHVVTTPKPYSGSSTCDIGTLAKGGITDSLVRINMHRWLVGLDENVTDDATANAGDQACAVIEANNPLSHTPPTSYTCYNSLGATWAGKSNIAYGSDCAGTIDLYMEDPGNATTIGHRRWILNPPLGKVGVGYYEYGGKRGECLGVFDGSGSGPNPSWYAYPPPGYVPVSSLWKTWTFHIKPQSQLSGMTITVQNLTTGTPAKVNIGLLNQGYGDPAISFIPSGWTMAADNVYRVTVTPADKNPIVYDVRAVTCL